MWLPIMIGMNSIAATIEVLLLMIVLRSHIVHGCGFYNAGYPIPRPSCQANEVCVHAENIFGMVCTEVKKDAASGKQYYLAGKNQLCYRIIDDLPSCRRAAKLFGSKTTVGFTRFRRLPRGCNFYLTKGFSGVVFNRIRGPGRSHPTSNPICPK